MMDSKRIQNWLKHWDASKMVDLDAITSFDRVYEARKYCECMRVGVFANVTDLQIWNELRSMRAVRAALEEAPQGRISEAAAQPAPGKEEA